MRSALLSALMRPCWWTVTVDSSETQHRSLSRSLPNSTLGWFEEPVQPTSDPEDLAAIARWAPMPVAGGESGYGVEFFNGLLDTEAVSVVMPDIKHCGGAVEGRKNWSLDRHEGKGVLDALPIGPDLAACERTRDSGRPDLDAPRARGVRGGLASRSACTTRTRRRRTPIPNVVARAWGRTRLEHGTAVRARVELEQ